MKLTSDIRLFIVISLTVLPVCLDLAAAVCIAFVSSAVRAWRECGALTRAELNSFRPEGSGPLPHNRPKKVRFILHVWSSQTSELLFLWEGGGSHACAFS